MESKRKEDRQRTKSHIEQENRQKLENMHGTKEQI